MAYFISNKQALAGMLETGSVYTPYPVDIVGCSISRYTVPLGHPLYPYLSEIVEIQNVEASGRVVFPVIPNGCQSMLFYYREGRCLCKMAGIMDHLRKIVLRPGERIMALVFLPGCCNSFLKVKSAEITNRVMDIKDTVTNGSQLIDIFQRDIPVKKKLHLMARALRVNVQEYSTDYVVRSSIEIILERCGNVSIAELSEKCGFSRRYIGMLYEKYVGLPPKAFAEIIRFQNSLYILMDPARKSSLLEVAEECGYFDHAHINRAYNEYLGCSSGALRKLGFAAIDYNKVESLI